MTEGPTEMEITPPRAPFWSRISIVWLVPFLALAVSLGVAWKTFADRGPVIEVAFSDAAGIAAGQTPLKYRDVDVGVVEEIRFTKGLERVVAVVRLEKEIAPYVDAGSQFWVVRPEVTTRGVSGLETVLSGAYIEGAWDNEIGDEVRSFDGLDRAPVSRPDQSGTGILLRAREGGQVAVGSPILFKGIEVGRVQAQRLASTGESVIIEAFINAPYDRRITSATRFWDASGFSVSLGTQGVRLDVSSLAALVAGGISFDTVFSGGRPIRDGHVFDLYEDEEAARESVFNRRLQEEVQLAIYFEGSVSGLTAGAPVEFRGIRVGEVTGLTAVVEGDGDDAAIRLLATISVRPDRLGLAEGAGEEATYSFLTDRVAEGLRARITTANIITGSLMIELTELPDARPAAFDPDGEPFPILPSVEAELSDVTASAQGVFERINELPVEELMDSAIRLLDNLDRLAADPATRATPEEARALLAETRALVGSDNVQAIPDNLNKTIMDVRALVAQIEEGGAVANLLAALDDAKVATDNISSASADFPDLVKELNALTRKANALKVEDLVAAATGVMQTADTLIGSEDAGKVPPALASALEEIDAVLTEFRNRGAIDNLVAALAFANSAAESIDRGAQGVPQLVADLNALAASARELPLDDLVTSAAEVVRTADTLLGSEETARVPPALASALEEVEAVLTELREGGAVANTNRTLGSARAAADAVAAAAENLPTLVARLDTLTRQATATLDQYGAQSQFNFETVATLREIRKAAEAVTELARTLDRRPNSIILGR